METGFIQYAKDIWQSLNRTIYVGERRKSNMLALSFASVVTALLGITLTVANIYTGTMTMLVPAIVTAVAGCACGYCSIVLDNREMAIKIPTLFCMFAFTVYLFTSAGEGAAIMWSLLMPIGMCYFVSVKYGILLSLYYTILYFVYFFTPLNEPLKQYYNSSFIERFPLLFACLSLFTGMAMIQYHRTALFEIDHANKLAEEVAKQTAVAEERSKKIEQMSFETIQTLAHAIDAKDPYTRGHSTRVSEYSVKVAEALGWETDKVNELRFSALLHDIGKIGVPDSILNNPRRLTDVEYGIIKSHTTMGGDILKGKVMIGIAENVARSHHERYDGKGYPQGLSGEDISDEARIVAIADSFDAMNSNRVYRRACDPEHIRNELIKGKGAQFDPKFTDVFIDLWEKGELDSIIKDDAIDADETARLSSAKLQEALEKLVSDSRGKNGEAGTPDPEIEKLLARLDDDGYYDGALSVGYLEFSRLHEFAEHLQDRFSYPFMLMVITLGSVKGEEPSDQVLANSMFYMEQSIRQTIRDVDIVTKFGKKQFLVILLGAEAEGAKSAADRIFKGYYKMNGSDGCLPSYKIADQATK